MRGMRDLFAVLGITYLAFCVRLAARIINRREKWATRLLAVLIATPVLYVLSFGPACWLTAIDNRIAYTCMDKHRPPRAMMIYAPVGSFISEDWSSSASDLCCWWMTFGVRPGFAARVPTLPGEVSGVTVEPGWAPFPRFF
jgi:hypothetical protein